MCFFQPVGCGDQDRELEADAHLKDESAESGMFIHLCYLFPYFMEESNYLCN